MQISHNKVVSITYELRLEPDGDVVDRADRQNPFSFLFGHQNVLEKFEENLAGKSVGNKFDFVLSPAEGYGDYEEEAVLQLNRSFFSHNGVIQEDMIFVGNVIPLMDQDGNPFHGRIVNIVNDNVTVDLNHPLAGKTLYFSGEVVDVRDAHPMEIQHGHVHPHGNHHHD
ncbi:MAG: FKBP-type peptidyl-prolyl cis-trans isomerase [Chitinophagales bacterium]|nr:FKBP-type peptidyl-prolyl cis-trans isomerase [Chitinophagales bacterium]MDW8418316.1 FKBP-type peptidyl-prolyl cis-trans isomerase [Chitinophagales bacterium]